MPFSSLTIQNLQIGSATNSGSTSIILGVDSAVGGLTNNLTLSGIRWRNNTNLGSGNKRLVSIQAGAGGGTAGNATISISDCIAVFESGQTSTTAALIYINADAEILSVTLNGNSFDLANTGTASGGAGLALINGGGTLTASLYNTIFAGNDTSHHSIYTSGTHISINGSGNVFSDSNTNNGLTGKLSSTIWAGTANHDMYLAQGSPAIGAGVIPAVASDIIGGNRPRGTLIDAGAVNLQTISVSLPASGNGTFTVTPQTASSQAGTDGTHYSACSIGSFSLPAGTKMAYVQNLDANSNVIAQGSATLVVAGGFPINLLAVGAL
jgi:hypothetical protein